MLAFAAADLHQAVQTIAVLTLAAVCACDGAFNLLV